VKRQRLKRGPMLWTLFLADFEQFWFWPILNNCGQENWRF
jgi:hypothetical protein